MATSNKVAETKFALELEGAGMGLLKSVAGGGVFAEVITITLGSDLLPRKHLGPAQYENFKVQLGLGLADAMYDWIEKSWTSSVQRKSGSIIVTDNKLRAQSRRDFSDALITETTIPAMDATSKEPAWLTLKLAAESIQSSKSTGKTIGTVGKEKLFQSSGFRLEIDGLDCKRVSNIESFTVKRKVATAGPGGSLIDQSRLEFPNLQITLAEAGADDWIEWADDFIINGNNSSTNEKNGTLFLLSPNLKTELARVKLFNLGICRLTPEITGPTAIRRLRTELYCERMEFTRV
jgi:phage tail-like protein